MDLTRASIVAVLFSTLSFATTKLLSHFLSLSLNDNSLPKGLERMFVRAESGPCRAVRRIIVPYERG